MFGGPKKYIIDRYIKHHLYRRILRPMWLPFIIVYTLGCMGMRQYDNAAHDYFYFSD